MSRVLPSLLGVVAYCYIDDIVIYSENYTEHLKHLRQVFEKIVKLISQFEIKEVLTFEITSKVSWIYNK